MSFQTLKIIICYRVCTFIRLGKIMLLSYDNSRDKIFLGQLSGAHLTQYIIRWFILSLVNKNLKITIFIKIANFQVAIDAAHLVGVKSGVWILGIGGSCKLRHPCSQLVGPTAFCEFFGLRPCL